MSQNKETVVLLLAVIISMSILGLVSWLIIKELKNEGVVITPTPTPTPSQSTPTLTSPSPPTSAVTQFSQVSNVPSGLFNYGGSTTWAPIRKEVDTVIKSVWPEFNFVYTNPTTGTPGSSKGIKMLIDNQLSFAQSSRSLKKEEINNGKFPLKEIPVAVDGIAVAVHPDLNVPGITITQLKDIYTCKITNWSQVGGPNIPIITYSRRVEDSGTVEFFVENVLEEKKAKEYQFCPQVNLVYSTTPGLQQVAQNRGGIYYASAPEIVPQCQIKPLALGRKTGEWIAPYQDPYIPPSQCPEQRNQVNHLAFQQGNYPITRRLFVIIKEDGSIDQQAGNAYANLLLTEQGQDLIEKAGFVRIR